MGMRKSDAERRERPDPEWVRGVCPKCGEELVSSCYYVSGRGYLVVWECWASGRSTSGCDYRRVL